jgi:methionyl-tRNA synthetase
MLKDWIASGPIQPQMINKLNEWFTAGLQEWDISRDAPYWGFEIPTRPASISTSGWMRRLAIWPVSRTYCDRAGLRFDDFWNPDSDAEVYHFIGKDIAYFHILFWPAS